MGIAIVVIYSHYGMSHLQSIPVNLFLCITLLGNHKMLHFKAEDFYQTLTLFEYLIRAYLALENCNDFELFAINNYAYRQ